MVDMEIGIVRRGAAHVLTLKGRIRPENWRTVERHIEALLEKGCRELVLELDGITFLCSAGLGALTGLTRLFAEQGRRLSLLSGTAPVRDLLEAACGPAFLARYVFADWELLESLLETPARPSDRA
jgi:anti-anti-sigma factor